MPPSGCERVNIHIGTSGWSDNHWTAVLYPPGTPSGGRLRLYSGQFDTVELNSTFYRWPREAAFARWREQVPAGFLRPTALRDERCRTAVRTQSRRALCLSPAPRTGFAVPLWRVVFGCRPSLVGGADRPNGARRGERSTRISTMTAKGMPYGTRSHSGKWSAPNREICPLPGHFAQHRHRIPDLPKAGGERREP